MKLNFNKERFKQILLTVIAFSLILVGYLNYNFNKNDLDSVQVSSEDLQIAQNTRNETNLGDVQLVNSEPEGAIVSNDDLDGNITKEENGNEVIEENYVEDVKNNYEDNNNYDEYFEESRIERERMYSETLETYQNLVNSNETPSDQKAIAVQEISNITRVKNGIIIAENLIKNKGFEDVVILENAGMVNVIVKSISLNQEQISKIQNIIERQLGIEAKNINISNK